MLMTFGQDAVTVRQDLSTFLAVKAGSEYILTTAIIRMYITYAGPLLGFYARIKNCTGF
jgi:hypothetical protein